MTKIHPVDEVVQRRVVIEVQRYIHLASTLYQKDFPPINIKFNIKGKVAGMYRCFYKKNKKKDTHDDKAFIFLQKWLPQKSREIRFNPWLFSKYPEDSWDNTIPHEVAHYISDCLYGLQNIKPHGIEWRNIMKHFDAEPIVRGDYSLEGIPVKKMRRYNYRCGCREVALSSIRHRKIQSGQQDFRCHDCRKILVLAD